MNNETVKGIHWSIYVVYAFFLTIALLYIRFPSEKFMRYCEYRLSNMVPDTLWHLENISWSFPATVTFDSVTVEKATPLIIQIAQLKKVRLKFHPLHLGKSFNLSASLFGGEIESELEMTPVSHEYSLSGCSFADIDLDQMHYFRQRYDRNMAGKLSGRMQLQGNLTEKNVRSGSGNIKIVSGNVEIKNSIFALTELEFKQLSFAFDIKDNTGSISDGLLTSTQLQADFSGSLSGAASSENSDTLGISGKLVFQESFFEDKPQVLRVVKRLQKQHKSTALPFNLFGTVEEPVLKFDE